MNRGRPSPPASPKEPLFFPPSALAGHAAGAARGKDETAVGGDGGSGHIARRLHAITAEWEASRLELLRQWDEARTLWEDERSFLVDERDALYEEYRRIAVEKARLQRELSEMLEEVRGEAAGGGSPGLPALTPATGARRRRRVRVSGDSAEVLDGDGGGASDDRGGGERSGSDDDPFTQVDGGAQIPCTCAGRVLLLEQGQDDSGVFREWQASLRLGTLTLASNASPHETRTLSVLRAVARPLPDASSPCSGDDGTRRGWVARFGLRLEEPCAGDSGTDDESIDGAEGEGKGGDDAEDYYSSGSSWSPLRRIVAVRDAVTRDRWIQAINAASTHRLSTVDHQSRVYSVCYGAGGAYLCEAVEDLLKRMEESQARKITELEATAAARVRQAQVTSFMTVAPSPEPGNTNATTDASTTTFAAGRHSAGLQSGSGSRSSSVATVVDSEDGDRKERDGPTQAVASAEGGAGNKRNHNTGSNKEEMKRRLSGMRERMQRLQHTMQESKSRRGSGVDGIGGVIVRGRQSVSPREVVGSAEVTL